MKFDKLINEYTIGDRPNSVMDISYDEKDKSFTITVGESHEEAGLTATEMLAHVANYALQAAKGNLETQELIRLTNLAR